ncbi:Septum formation inhibitor MinC [Gloeomargarita lithophora Alchichica-D10]|uniref:Probable septum site-determining protein MinC n=1 Tax=Gloeomargarita lithophora Alchichica-D10 TaxID=1188229 RepID=A0A1J0AFD9_9CYAN|nr:septum site-determining protein MinC [Gloeomargarita lithophora]APB34657.1 Septum formation inhibitor MinC [Gloeomargarita lithophora Alchichica-D10]
MNCPLVQPGAAGLDLTLPPEPDWLHLQELLQQYFQISDSWWQPETPVRVLAGARVLGMEHIQWLAELLQKHQLIITNVQASLRATAVAAAMAGYSVEQGVTASPSAIVAAPALYLDHAVRSGVEIRHPGTVVLAGDVNPGGCIVADGDILVWGRLRGVAHAGANGNPHRLIMALQMAATQLRIGGLVARAPANVAFYPEVAWVQGDAIVLHPARDFGRTSPGGVF